VLLEVYESTGSCQNNPEKVIGTKCGKARINLNKKYTFVWFAAMGERFNATSNSLSNVYQAFEISPRLDDEKLW